MKTKHKLIGIKIRDKNNNLSFDKFISRTYCGMQNRSLKKGFKEIISFSEFCEFSYCNKNRIMAMLNEWVNTGDIRKRPTIDRIDNSRGYTSDNIRYISYSLNSHLGNFGKHVVISEETRRKMSESQKGISKKWYADKISEGTKRAMKNLSQEKKDRIKYGSALGTHNRWHKNRNLFNPRCKICQAERKEGK